eukprot:scaffold12693_cov142-Isochrysis_galbana.AAC.4
MRRYAFRRFGATAGPGCYAVLMRRYIFRRCGRGMVCGRCQGMWRRCLGRCNGRATRERVVPVAGGAGPGLWVTLCACALCVRRTAVHT